MDLREAELEQRGKENVDLVNRMKAYKDPLLEEFDKEEAETTASKKTGGSNKEADSDDSDESSGSEESSDGSQDGGAEIKFPRDSCEDLLRFIQRDLTNLSNHEDDQKRKFSLIRLYQIFVLSKNKAPNRFYQELLGEIQKPLFKRLFDKIEKSRELAALIIKEFFARTDDLTMSIPYLIPILVERLNAEDLEGVDYLDEKMKPVSIQKAQEIIDPIEKSEQVRVCIAEIVTIIVSSTIFDCLRPYCTQIVNILKAICMDPYGDAIIEGTRAISAFCAAGEEQLIHFCEAMGRSLFTAFVHKHAKVRIAGLRALFNVMLAGQWKTSYSVLEAMVGFRDPNIVPIKEFYDPSTKVNYFAMFIVDRSTQVRICFYKTMGKLLHDLPDRVDMEGRIFPYLISGLYDPHEDTRQAAFEIIEELGLQHEEQNEEKFREVRQFAYVPEFMFAGKIKDEHIPLPHPLVHRPRIGARLLVRSYCRRYLRALYKELGEWIDDHQERASNLLMYSICYVEEFMTQYLDHLFIAMYKALEQTENKTVKKNIPLCLQYIGRYVNPKAWGPLVLQAIRNELASFYTYTAPGALRSFGYLFAGSMELLQPGMDIAHSADQLAGFIDAIEKTVVNFLDIEVATNMVESIDVIIEWCIKKQEQDVDVRIVRQYLPKILEFLLKAQSAYMTYKLQKKPEPDNIIAEKKKVWKVINNLTKLSDNQDIEFFDAEIANLVDNNYSDIVEQYEAHLKEHGDGGAEYDQVKDYGVKDGPQIHQKDKDDKEEIFVPWKEPEPGTEEYEKQQRTAKHLDCLAMIEKNRLLMEKAKEEGKELSVAQQQAMQAAVQKEMDRQIDTGKTEQKGEKNGEQEKKEGAAKGKVPEWFTKMHEEDKAEKSEQTQEQIDSSQFKDQFEKQTKNMNKQDEEEPEPVIKEVDNMKIVPVDKPDGEVVEEEENFTVDHLLSVKNWTMQTHEWKFFNAIFESLSEEQFQYKCKNGKTIFENFSLILKLALVKSDQSGSYKDKEEKLQMTQVKSYILTYSLPSIINKTLKYVKPEYTAIYLNLFEQAQKIEGHLRDYMQGKMKHYSAIQKLHLQLQNCKGVRMSSAHIGEYERFFTSFLKTFANVKNEELKRDGFKILRYYMTCFYLEIIAPIDQLQQKEDILLNLEVMSKITDVISSDIDNYHESVKEEAQLLLICMVQRFLPPEISMPQEQMDLVQQLRANLSMGWPNQLNGKLKDAAQMERDMLKYLFTDAIKFVSRILTVYMDESYGREHHTQVFRLINTACPMLLMNDYRISKQQSALSRVALLDTLIKQV